MDFLRSGPARTSVRAIAKEAGIANGYLSMVLAGSRELSAKALAKLAPALGLSASERSFFELLVTLGTADSQAVRIATLERMRRFTGYERLQARESEVQQYLTRPYYVAIREMAGLPGFQPEAGWIQERLEMKASIPEINAALDFLLKHRYIEATEDGGHRIAEKRIECVGGIYRIGLAQLHEGMLREAIRAIHEVPSTERNILCHTVALDEKGFERAQNILTEALAKIAEIPSSSHAKAVYHTELALFPITRRKSK